MLGWIGWTLCFTGNYFIGNKWRWGFAVTFVSEIILLLHSFGLQDYALSTACVAWMGLHIRNFIKWGKT